MSRRLWSCSESPIMKVVSCSIRAAGTGGVFGRIRVNVPALSLPLPFALVGVPFSLRGAASCPRLHGHRSSLEHPFASVMKDTQKKSPLQLFWAYRNGAFECLGATLSFQNHTAAAKCFFNLISRKMQRLTGLHGFASRREAGEEITITVLLPSVEMNHLKCKTCLTYFICERWV